MFMILSLFGHIYVQYYMVLVCIYYTHINIPITRISVVNIVAFLRLDYLEKVCVFQKL